MSDTCSVVGCSNARSTEEGVRFFRFPSRYEEQRDLWIKSMNRVNADGSIWQPSQTSVVCSDHFTSGRPNPCQTHTDYYPTIFPTSEKNHKSKSTDPIDNMKTEKKKKKEFCCRVVGCKSKQPTVKFYNFSRRNLKQRELWIKAVNQVQPGGSAWLPKNKTRLCGKHFVSGAPSSNRSHPDYVPTIFPGLHKKSRKPESKSKKPDFHQVLKRPAQKKISNISIRSDAIVDLNDLHTVEYFHKNDCYIKRWSCSECKKKFLREASFWKHMVEHKGSYKCTTCSNSFPDLGQMAHHLTKSHFEEGSEFICKICHLECVSRPIFEEHVNLHFNIRPHVCEICKRRYCKALSLKMHMDKVHNLKIKQEPVPCFESRKVLGFEDSSSILIDRIQDPEVQACRSKGQVPMAIYKRKGRSNLVRVLSAFPSKDLLVPVSADELSTYLPQSSTTIQSGVPAGFTGQFDESNRLIGQSGDPTSLAGHLHTQTDLDEHQDDESLLPGRQNYSLVPVAVIVEQKIDPEGKESLVISQPGGEHSQGGYPVKILKPKAKSNPKFGVPNVKIFRKENDIFSVKKHLRHLQKLQNNEKMDCNFVDLVDFGCFK